MATYLIINCIILAMLVIVLWATRTLIWNRAATITLVILLVSTAIFDSMIVGFGIVAYDPALILGLRIIEAPIEDFFYSIAAMLLVPAVWHALGGSKYAKA